VNRRIISMEVDVINLSIALSKVEALAITSEANKKGSYVCVSNVHMCMEVFDSVVFAEIVNGADLTIPDGKPLYWAQKLLGHSDAEQVRGQDIMNALCARYGKNSDDKQLNIGLYGGSSDVLLKQVNAELKSFASIPSINR
jgi:N-acetylglucosaminyldiphosphoundecaprenol N-acetyl-beta-D-mannosaminyltransferase